MEEEGAYRQSYTYDNAGARVSGHFTYADKTARGQSGENPSSDMAAGLGVVHYRRNLLTSSTYATEGDDTLAAHMTYDDWGLPETEPKMDMNYAGLEGLNDYGGYVYDEVLGTYYAQKRIYTPEDRRFLSVDPYWTPENMIYGNGRIDLAGAGKVMPDLSAMVQSANRYAYVINNPLKYIDPWGEYKVEASLELLYQERLAEQARLNQERLAEQAQKQANYTDYANAVVSRNTDKAKMSALALTQSERDLIDAKIMQDQARVAISAADHSEITVSLMDKAIAGARESYLESPACKGSSIGFMYGFPGYDAAGMSDERRQEYNTKIYLGEIIGIFPVDGKYSDIMESAYGDRKLDYEPAARLHAGTDISANSGTPIRNMYYGEVITAGYAGAYGNRVIVRSTIDEKVLDISFAHMNKIPLVKVGDLVIPGDQLGEVGNTGQSTGPHVHIEVRDSKGNPINPDPNYTRYTEDEAKNIPGAKAYNNKDYDHDRPYPSYIPYKMPFEEDA